MVLRNDGTVVAWGSNLYGEADVPIGLSGVTAITAGRYHTVALVGSGLAEPVPLSARLGGNGLILSWPTNATGFTLQSTLTLSPPVSWNDWTSPPGVVGNEFTVTNSLFGTLRFYRLIKP